MTTRSLCIASFAGLLAALVWSPATHAATGDGLGDGLGQPGPATPESAPVTPAATTSTPAPASSTNPAPTPSTTAPANPGPSAGVSTSPAPSPAPTTSTVAPTEPASVSPATATAIESVPDPSDASPAWAVPGESSGSAGPVVTADANTGPATVSVPAQVSAPLPPPLPPVDPATIRRGPWRGVGWVAVHLTLTGPLGGDRPSRPTVLSSGFGFEAGWRLNNVLALGTGVSRQTHERSEEIYVDQITGDRISERSYGELTNFDAVFARGYLPLRGRVQPYLDVGGGIAILEPTDDSIVAIVGGHGRAGVGFDAWIARNLTLGAGVRYRMAALDGAIGHMAQGYFQFGVHW